MTEPKARAALRLNGQITIVQSVASARVGEETLVHDMITQECYRLNAVGTRVWDLIDAGMSTEELIRAITAEYDLPDDVSLNQVREDVTTILSELFLQGLVQLERGS